jgi:hypothetical protein
MRPERIEGAGFLAAKRLAAGSLALFWFLLIHAAVSRAAPSPQQSPARPAYTTQSFVQELQRLKAGLQAASKSPEALRAYRESLPKAWSVDVGGRRRRYEVPSDLIAERINKAEKQPELREQQISQTSAYLDALAEETEALSARSPSNDAAARAKLNAILSRSEYAQVREESWWDKMRDRIYEILSSALDRILRRVGGQGSLGYALLWIALCAAVVLIAYWIVQQWSRRGRGEEMDLQAAAAPARSWQEWVFAAREAAGRGDYRMAIHCAYWAGIARLQDLGTLAPDRAKTPREYLRALANSKLVMPEMLAPRQMALSTLTSRLEKTWYGYQTATEADFRDSLTQLEALGCHLP